MSESEEIQEILEQLSVLAPLSSDELPSASAAALARFKGRVTPQMAADTRELRSRNIMSNKRSIAAGLTFVVAIALLVAFPSVRAAAGEFLGLFRVQKFAPISVSPQQMALLGQLQEQGLAPGELVMVSESGEPTAVDTLETAAQLTGYQLRQLADRDLPEIYLMGDASGYLDINLAGARAIVEAAGADPLLLPDSLDGARVTVQTYDSVQQLYADGLMVMQTAVPDVTYPPDVDPTVLGEALLQVLGVEPAAAHQLAQSIDWTSTMLLPIPQDLGAYREVTVDGMTGVAVEPFDSGSDPAIVWQKDGMVYMMTGPVPVDELINQANALQ